MENSGLEGDLSTILRSPLAAVEEEAILVSDDPLLVEHVITTLADLGADVPETVRLLSTVETLDGATTDFFTAVKAAELAEDGLVFRSTEARSLPSLLITPSSLVTVVALPGERAVRIETDDDDLLVAVRGAYLSALDSAREYEVTEPPYSTMLEQLAGTVGEATSADLEQVVREGVEVRGDRDGLDEVQLALLLGARNRALHYDLSRWAEDAGVASRATVSNKKRALEDADLIRTEGVKDGIGRPKHRLELTDDLQDLDPTDVVRCAKAVLAE